ncbi:MAG: lipoic acid synthetase [Candidatus Omnitrophota bacterium]|jgi:lipoic acid synthetase
MTIARSPVTQIDDYSRFGNKPNRLPQWLRKSLKVGKTATSTTSLLSDLGLNTICESGKCPNRNECYSQNTATFMILGDLCTRNCRYCSVKPGKPTAPDANEAAKVTEAIFRLGLEHVVITSVTRDDIADEGVSHFEDVLNAIRAKMPNIVLEVLTPDFKRDINKAAKAFAGFPIDIFNHNIETVKEQHGRMRPQGGYLDSLALLKEVKRLNPKTITKSGAMLGVGETRAEVLVMLDDLRSVQCDMLTLGQYLQPEKQAYPIHRYVEPAEFDFYKREALDKGFLMVESGPFVRSSFHAKDSFIELKEHLKHR